jgi:hypothetical protein
MVEACGSPPKRRCIVNKIHHVRGEAVKPELLSLRLKGGPVSICPKHMRNMLQILCRTPLPLTELAARLTVRGKVTNAHTELAMEE